MNTELATRINRRQAIRWMLTAFAGASLSRYLHPGLRAAETRNAVAAKGYGPDPDLLKTYNPGDFWPLTFTENQRRDVMALCDTILPADDSSPRASALGAPEFIDECVSSPYPDDYNVRPTILEGLAWLEAESKRRFKAEFRDLTEAQKHAICDDICFIPKAKPEFTKAAVFFTMFRFLTMVGYYTTPEGMKALGYIGNTPQLSFDGPPPELLKKLGLA